MKKILWILFLSGIVALILALAITQKANAKVEKLPATITPKENLNYQQKAWLGALEWCESKGNPNAINPKDRDNTPSYGILQFKPSTFILYQKQYATDGELMDPTAQESIVEQMIIKDNVKWSQQFPDCVKKLGKPPVIHIAKVDKK